ncbi:MAG: type II secretion system protein GspF, partial [Comamonadaceae bacterium]
MPAYTFEALDAQGATQKGLIDADTARAARSMLRARALVPLVVEPATTSSSGERTGGLNVTLWGGRVFGATALAVWTRQLAGLVSAGLPLERALT